MTAKIVIEFDVPDDLLEHVRDTLSNATYLLQQDLIDDVKKREELKRLIGEVDYANVVIDNILSTAQSVKIVQIAFWQAKGIINQAVAEQRHAQPKQ